MDREVKCSKCEKVFTAGERGALPMFCSDCRPEVYKSRYAGRYYSKRTSETFPYSQVNRKLRLEKDNWTCQNCGSKSNIHVHHLDGKSTDKVREDANNKLENLITLCHKCHLTVYHASTTKSKKSLSLIDYHGRHPGMSYSALSRVFHLSRERVGQILGRKHHKSDT